jgi:hypothetical protein
VSSGEVAKFLEEMKRADYWNTPAESLNRGSKDGAEWILEGSEAGRYHVAVRWCPGYGPEGSQLAAFADAARVLLAFAGQERNGGC